MTQSNTTRSIGLALMTALSLSACNGNADGAPFGTDGSDDSSLTPSIPNPSTPSTSLKARGFGSGASRLVAMDFGQMNLDLNIDASAQTTRGTAKIDFATLEAGQPYFLLKGQIESAKLDGQEVTIGTQSDPDKKNDLRVVAKTVSPGSRHTLEVQYLLSDDSISYRTGGVGLVTAMADIDDGNFFEDYGPTNFEDDQYAMTLNLSLSGASNTHRLFTNGKATQNSATAWKVDFPAYFTTSSFYFHVTDQDLAVRTGTYKGLTHEIPITVYASSASSADSAMSQLSGLFKELEGTYGPYLHSSFTAYISGSGGMEHDGATITSLSALGHELTHSWFGRGVMPSGGSSGWIDEAIASWRDEGYGRVGSISNRSTVNLAGLSLYERFTPYAAYDSGERLMTELDYLFASQGGLKPQLAGFYGANKGGLTTTPMFLLWLEQKTGVDLTEMFERYVFGGGDIAGEAAPSPTPVPSEAQTPRASKHPPALTREEIEALR